MYLIHKRNNVQAGRQWGFTVVELLIGLTAIAIVILLAVPGASMAIEKYRLKNASGNLFTGLELARTEAYKRSSTVRVCPSSNGRNCRTDGNWNLGWLVFSDGNGNGTVQEIELIRVFKAPDQHVSISASGAVQTMASFNVAGLVQDNGDSQGEFEICLKASGSEPRIVAVEQEGLAKFLPPQNRTCESS